MGRPTILADIVFRHCSKPEDAATDALVYLLMANPNVRHEFQKFIQEKASIKIPDIVKFESRRQQDSGACPDIVGVASNGQQVLFIENKFWAGLTENQPIQYLLDLKETMGPQDSGLLLFICPDRALPMYSDELFRRVSASHVISREVKSAKPFHCIVEGRISLFVASWQGILEVISRSAIDSGENNLVDDTEQLQGLVDQIDSDQAFIPLKSEDLGAEHGRRWREFDQIQWDLVNHLVSNPHNMGYHQNSNKVDIGGKDKWESVVGIEFGLWAKFGRTPFWMVISRHQPQFDFFQEALQPLIHSTPPAAYEIKWWGTDCVCVPLPPLLGVSRNEVIKDLIAQVCKVKEILLENEMKNK